MVLCPRFARRPLPMDSTPSPAVQPPALSGPARAVSGRLVRLGLCILLCLPQQTARLSVALVAAAGCAHGDRAVGSCTGQNFAGRLWPSVLHSTSLAGSAAPSPCKRHFSRVLAFHLI